MRKNLTLAFFALFCALTAAAQLHNDDVHVHQAVSRQNYRQYLRIPDIGGYITLKCDFHVHSDISDGQVWPVGRVNEAWNDGLDAIAMTDHIEVHKNADIIRCGLNKPYELAKARGDMIGMIVIPGAEITRKKPLGHICTLFIRDADKLDVEDEMQAVEEACRQGAFLLWNHPGYPDRKSDIYPVHERLIAQGKLRGVEVFNKTESYPRAFDYAVQYGLVPFANSDIHYMSGSIYPVRGSRPMTLVFATARTAGAIREALLAGRALACFDGNLMGRGEYIGQMIDAALEIREIRQVSKTKRTFEIVNKSDLRFAVRPSGLLRLSHARLCGAGAAHRHQAGRAGRIHELHPRQGQVLHPHILGIGRRAYAAGAQRCDGPRQPIRYFVTEAIFKPRMQ